MVDCIQLKISEEDIGSEHANASSTPKHELHRHGFFHKHYHHQHDAKYDSSKWTGDEHHYPGLKATSKVAPVESTSKFVAQSENENGSINSDSHIISTTEERRNPFAVRKGNTFMWQNVNMTLVSDTASHIVR